MKNNNAFKSVSAQQNNTQKLKAALKFGGSMALATVAGDIIFFNKNWKGKGKIPAMVSSVLDGAAIGSITSLMHYAGLCDSRKSNKNDTATTQQEVPTTVSAQKTESAFAGRIKHAIISNKVKQEMENEQTSPAP